jgi:hypothetical protein
MNIGKVRSNDWLSCLTNQSFAVPDPVARQNVVARDDAVAESSGSCRMHTSDEA